VEWNGAFLFLMSFFVQEIFGLSYYAKLVADGVVGCAGAVV